MTDIRAHLEQGVLEITLCRASKRNALTARMYGEMAQAIEAASAADEVRAILFSGEGRDFCAGNDLDEFLGDYELAHGSPWRRFLDALPAAEKPLVAAVHGNAVGIGMTMLLHFDLVYVEPSARLSAPFASLGVVPEAGSSGLLRDLIGQRRASEVFLLARVVDAAEAVQLGLANAVVPEGSARHAARDAARAIARLSPQAVRECMRLRQSAYATVAERVDAECAAFMRCIRSPETRDILRKLTSRPPRAAEGAQAP